MQSSQQQKPANNSALDYLIIYIKGIAMGAADIVPGVSGGTIALIAGIYTRLISAISRADLKILKIWKNGGLINGFIDVWKYMDATFLLVLAAGIGTSVITLAGFISHMLKNQPLIIWSLFFGLMLATVLILFKEIKDWNIKRILLFIAGLLIAIGISLAPNVTGTPSLPYLFFAGSIAICAMILPGVSGSFILVLLGAYNAVLTAVHQMQLSVLATVFTGMICGLLAFSKLLKWLLSRFYQATLALLTGFIAGSLLKVYPWQVDGQYFLPQNYPDGAHLVTALILMMIGAGLVFIISHLGKNQQ
ncbi:DUF368 domain-containing protein [Psychrobacter sp. HD31]|uniref:DUF368 domain-containing protein n=1 Tax=Psychrobacter sp. HD31 TaxID=3112003 RepID=UPI003DA33D1F